MRVRVYSANNSYVEYVSTKMVTLCDNVAIVYIYSVREVGLDITRAEIRRYDFSNYNIRIRRNSQTGLYVDYDNTKNFVISAIGSYNSDKDVIQIVEDDYTSSIKNDIQTVKDVTVEIDIYI